MDAVIPGFENGVGYQQIASFSTAQSLTVPSGAVRAIMIPTAAVRWLDGGTDPTATVGMPIAAGQVVRYTGKLANFRVIPQTGSATLDISYFA